MSDKVNKLIEELQKELLSEQKKANEYHEKLEETKISRQLMLKKNKELDSTLRETQQKVKIAMDFKNTNYSPMIKEMFETPKEDLKKSIKSSGAIALIISISIFGISLIINSYQSEIQQKIIDKKLNKFSTNIEKSILDLKIIQKETKDNNKIIEKKIIKRFSHSIVVIYSSPIHIDVINYFEKLINTKKKENKFYSSFPDVNIKKIKYIDGERYSLIIGFAETHKDAIKIKKKAFKYGFKDILVKKIIKD